MDSNKKIRHQRKNNRRAFTLIELIVVIAVLGILVLLAAPKFLGYTSKATDARIANDIKAYEKAVEIEVAKDYEFVNEFYVLDMETIQEVNDSEKAVNKKNKVVDNLGGELYILNEKVDVNSKLKGTFIMDENHEVFYYEEQLEGVPRIDSDDSEDDETQLEFTSEDNFTWVNDSKGYDVEGKSEKGYYKYTGTDEETVYIPHTIKGTEMTSYYKMFYYSGEDVKKVVSDNLNVTDMTSMFEESTATTLDLSKLDTSEVTDMKKMFHYAQATTLDVSKFDTSKVKNMNSMFLNVKVPNLNLSNFNTSEVTDMGAMFQNLKSTSLNVKSFDTSNVENMSEMFKSSEVENLDLSRFDTSEVTDMGQMFYNSKATTLDVSKFDTSKVTDMNWMFYKSQATLIDVSNWKTSNVIDMSYLFYYSKTTVINVSNWNTSSAIKMNSMFSNTSATTLDVSKFDTSKVTDMSDMFQSSKAKTLDFTNWNTSNVKKMTGMFADSNVSIIDLSSFDTSNVTEMNAIGEPHDDEKGYSGSGNGMFRKVQASKIILGENFKTDKVTSFTGMFEFAQTTEIEGLENLDTSNATQMIYMFFDSKVQNLNLSSFDTSNVVYMSFIFGDEPSINKVYAKTQNDIDNFKNANSEYLSIKYIIGTP